MKIATAAEMRQLDHLAITKYEIPGIVLMENAALQVVAAVEELISGVPCHKKAAVFVGKGNNGGDGLAVARHLANRGWEVRVFLLAPAGSFTGDALTNWRIVREMGIKTIDLTDNNNLNIARVSLHYTDIIIDAIFGIGFRGRTEGLFDKVINLINQSEKPVIAVDIPSGLEADTGKVKGSCIKAAVTVTFSLPKMGLLVEPGARYAGQVKVAEISIPKKLIDGQSWSRVLLTREFCQANLPPRLAESHKGNYGHVLVIGGSPGLTGAVALAGEAALRSGAGLVTAAVPASLNTILELKLTEVMTLPLEETEIQTVSTAALPGLKSKLENVSVSVIGPGLGKHPELLPFMRELLNSTGKPVVIDADGLNALAEDVGILANCRQDIVLTPHPGEMGRLLGRPVPEIQENRIEVALEAAKAWKAVVVLKGAKTVIATPKGKLYLNTTGNPGMATGGTGDVLAGMIGSFIAQGLPPGRAAAVAVYLHGLTGDRLAEQRGMMGLAAGDIPGMLPDILKDFEQRKGELPWLDRFGQR